MFSNSPFNKPIGNWDVSSVVSMEYMFRNTSFNQNISNWIVTNVTSMYQMFWQNNVFNQNLSSWNTINVTNCSLFSTSSTWTLSKPNFTNCNPD
jgi:surface protein